MRMRNVMLSLLGIGLLAVAACKKDEVPCATYDADMKAIFNNTCAYSGCHAGAAGDSLIAADSRDFTTYAGIKPKLDDGRIKVRALDQGSMPDSNAVATGHPKALTTAEKELMACWITAGYPEK